jgi:hypothetical protein
MAGSEDDDLDSEEPESTCMKVDLQHEVEPKVDCMLAKYFLTLETNHNVSKLGVNSIAASTASLMDEAITSVKKDVCSRILNDTLRKEISEVFQKKGPVHLNELSTAHRRQTFVKKKFKHVAPEKVLLGTSYVRGKDYEAELKMHCAYFIPLQKQLQCLLNLPEIWHYFKNYTGSKSDVMQDVCDGSYMKSHPLQLQGKPFLKLILSFDDVELQNPLRTSSNHKLSMFYFSLANIPVEHRSKLHNIFLVGIARSKDLKRFGLGKMLSDFTTTVNSMREGGIEMQIQGSQHCIEGDLIFAICDSPAAAFLGGFKESSSFAWKGCRMCNADQNSIKLHFNADNFQLRDMKTYENRCTVIENPNFSKAQRDHWSLLYGINSRSPLNSIKGFPVTRNLLMDPMHVLLEGATGHVMALFLHRCIIDLGLFSLKWLNSGIQSYKYSYIDAKNKPMQIDRKELVTNKFVKQKAASMLLLCYTLPHIIGDVFDDDDVYYKHFMSMVQIVQLSMLPFADATSAGQLEQLIMFYCREYKTLYPLAPVRPKMHFLIHLVSQMLEFGPLRCSNTFRYEGKHGWFKGLSIRNFINLPMTLAEKHQLLQSNRMTTVEGHYSENFVYSGDVVDNGKNVDIERLEADVVLSLKHVYDGNGEVNMVYKTPRIVVNGMCYKKGVCIIIKACERRGLTFGLLESMLFLGDKKYFVFQLLETGQFLWKLNAFEVSLSGKKVSQKFDTLENKWPLPVFNKDGKTYVTNRYCHIGQCN